MIYAELAGGLGNQMFIYAFARALGLRAVSPSPCWTGRTGATVPRRTRSARWTH